jgi:hypothetical protein
MWCVCVVVFLVVIPLFRVLGSHSMSDGIRQWIERGLLYGLDKGKIR